MAKLWRYTWRSYGDTHVETKEIHMAKLWRYTWRSYGDTHKVDITIHK